MKTRKKLLFPALFLLALLLTLMLTMFELMHSPSGWSIEENRALASAPQVSARSVWDGTLAQDAEAFYKDHIAARRLLLKLDTARLSCDTYLNPPLLRSIRLTAPTICSFSFIASNKYPFPVNKLVFNVLRREQTTFKVDFMYSSLRKSIL